MHEITFRLKKRVKTQLNLATVPQCQSEFGNSWVHIDIDLSIWKFLHSSTHRYCTHRVHIDIVHIEYTSTLRLRITSVLRSQHLLILMQGTFVAMEACDIHAGWPKRDKKEPAGSSVSLIGQKNSPLITLIHSFGSLSVDTDKGMQEDEDKKSWFFSKSHNLCR